MHSYAHESLFKSRFAHSGLSTNGVCIIQLGGWLSIDSYWGGDNLDQETDNHRLGIERFPLGAKQELCVASTFLNYA